MSTLERSGEGTAPESSVEPSQWRVLWRLEWWRVVRTRRILALIATYVFFGATAAPMARYTGELVARFGGGVQVTLPPPRPADGFVNYVSNANQIGLLVFVFVISTAVTLDANREMSVFMRTRVRRRRDLVLPRYAVNLGAAIGSLTLGALGTWWGTALLLGDVDAVGVGVGVALQAAYLAFIASVAAAFGARLHSALTTAAATLGVALGLAIVGVFDVAGGWLPGRLLSALSTMPAGAPAADFARPLAVTVMATALLLTAAVQGTGRRDR